MPMKEPLHPGKILHDILVYEEYELTLSDEDRILFNIPKDDILDISYISRESDLCVEDIKGLIKCEIDITHITAYVLGKFIKGTDMAFWLKLQQDYDCREDNLRFQKYVSKILANEALRIENVEFKTADEWESLEYRKLNPQPGDIVNDGINKKTYRGNGVWESTLLHENIDK